MVRRIDIGFHARGMCAAILLLAAAGPALADAPIVSSPSSYATSVPLSSMPKAQPSSGLAAIRPAPRLTLKGAKTRGPYPADPAIQNRHFSQSLAQPKLGFGGIGFSSNLPPDPDIAVGLTYIVQAVNSQVAVFDKSTGAMLAGYPVSLSSLWAPLAGSGCATNNGGDPSVQYDAQAKRWIITQLGSLSSPYSECIAVSTSDNPTGTYTLYAYSFGSSLNDYPKFSVWPSTNADYSGSAYLATYNMFYGSSGAQLCVYDRQAMLAGDPTARQVCQPVPEYSYLPSDLDGSVPPPTINGNTPAYFVTDDNRGNVQLRTATFSFGTTASLSVSGITTLPVQAFNPACGGGTCVPQAGTSRTLDSLADRPMYRLAYRNFGTSESMVFNHSVASGTGSGIRWFELCRTTSQASFGICQDSTHAPDGNYRWMGSMAINKDGVIGLGYSASGSGQYPSLRFTSGGVGGGGVMQTEQTLQPGGGSQTGYSRWGDYSSMRVDPSDDQTFWYTGEYYKTTSSYTWSTFIGSVNVRPDFALAASPTLLVFPEGASATQNVTIKVGAVGGYKGSVTLSNANCWTDFGAILTSPTTVTVPGSVTLPVSTAAAPAIATKTCDVVASDNTLTHTLTLSALRYPDFLISLYPPTSTTSTNLTAATVTRGTSTKIGISVPYVKTSSSVSLSISGLPSGVSASFSPSTVSTGPSTTSSLTLSARNTAKTGTFNVTVTGKNSNTSHSAPLTLTVK